MLLKWWSLCTPSSCRSCSLEASLSPLHPAPICAWWQSPICCCSAWLSLGSLGNALHMHGLLYLLPQSGSRPRTAEPCWVSFLIPGLHTCPVSCQSPVALWFRCCANNLTLIRCLVSRDKMLLRWALCHHRSFWSCRAGVPENKTAGTSGWRVYRRAFQPLASPLKPHQRYRELSLDQTELWTQCLCGSRLLFLGKSQLEATRAKPQPESQLDAAWPLLLSAHWVLRPTPAKQTSNCWRNPAEHSMAETSWVLRMGIQRDFICTGPSWLPGLFQGPQIGRWRLKAALTRVKWCYPSCVVRKLGSKKLIRSLSREKKQTVGIRCKLSAWKEFNSFIS